VKVYKGSLLSYTVSSLPANSCVEARVRTVRQANTKGDHLFSPFIDVKHRTLQSIAQATISEGEEHNEPIRDTTSKPSRLALTEKQVAFILFTLTVLVTLLAALGIGYWTV